jgi:hypothetical protein
MPPWQSQEAAEALAAAGYDATVVEIDGGDHANVIFSEIGEPEWIRADEIPSAARSSRSSWTPSTARDRSGARRAAAVPMPGATAIRPAGGDPGGPPPTNE